MSKTPLHRLLRINGSALALQGTVDLALGPWLHLGEHVTAGADSDARFLGGLLIGVGIFFLALSRRVILPLPAIEVLAAGMLLGAAGRLLSLLVTGTAAPLLLVVMAVEAVTSAMLLVFGLRAPHGARTTVVAA